MFRKLLGLGCRSRNPLRRHSGATKDGRPTRALPQVEPLETRATPTAFPTFAPGPPGAPGTLFIPCDGADDVLVLALDEAGSITLSEGGGAPVAVTPPGAPVFGVVVFGGGGNDLIDISALPVFPLLTVLDGGGGDDVLIGNAAGNILIGGEGSDVLIGMDGGDMLYGGDGDDYLDGGAGADMLFGGAGDDILVGGPDPDLIVGGPGTDIAFANLVMPPVDVIDPTTEFVFPGL